MANNTIEGNKLSGVLLLNTTGNAIGGTETAPTGSPNTIVSNGTDGVGIFNGGPNDVFGNIMGVNSLMGAGNAGLVSGTLNMANLGDGVHIVGSAGNRIVSNTISASHQSGVEIFGNSSHNAIVGNVIGTLSGDPTLGNRLNGILISGSLANDPNGPTDPTDNHVVGNYISGNQANGVAVNLADWNNDPNKSNYIQGNAIGISVPNSLANSLDGVNVSYSRGTMIQDNNLVAGNKADGIRLVQSGQTLIYYNSLMGNAVDGIGLDNSGGTNINGNLAANNKADGIRVYNGSTANAIGVPRPGLALSGNSLLHNQGAGVEISTGANFNRLEDNRIGFVGPGLISGNAIGVFLNQVSNNFVGGTSLADGANTITGNDVYGIEIAGNDPIAAQMPDTMKSMGGNLVQGNYIGTDPAGNSPGAFPDGVADVGVLVLNSVREKIGGNLISGNHLAGVELVGGQSTGNVVANNSVGPDASLQNPITFPTHGRLDYEPFYPNDPRYAPVRQSYGIDLNGTSPGNLVLGNNVLANQVGIAVQGTVAVTDPKVPANVIQGNNVGDLNYAHGGSNLTGLGNFDGIYVDNTSSTQIVSNILAGNISIGIGLVGPAASGNVVQRNIVAGTGGYSDPADYSPGTRFLVSLIPYSGTASQPGALQDAQAGKSVPIFGSGDLHPVRRLQRDRVEPGDQPQPDHQPESPGGSDRRQPGPRQQPGRHLRLQRRQEPAQRELHPEQHHPGRQLRGVQPALGRRLRDPAVQLVGRPDQPVGPQQFRREARGALREQHRQQPDRQLPRVHRQRDDRARHVHPAQHRPGRQLADRQGVVGRAGRQGHDRREGPSPRAGDDVVGPQAMIGGRVNR